MQTLPFMCERLGINLEADQNVEEEVESCFATTRSNNCLAHVKELHIGDNVLGGLRDPKTGPRTTISWTYSSHIMDEHEFCEEDDMFWGISNGI